MAQVASAHSGVAPTPASENEQQSLWKKWFNPGNGSVAMDEASQDDGDRQQDEEPLRPGFIRRVSRKVVPGIPRAQTFKRQQAEVRNNLEPVQPSRAERRAVSVDRRLHPSRSATSHPTNPRTSAPDFVNNDIFSATVSAPSRAGSVVEEKMMGSIGDLTVSEGIPDNLRPLRDAESFHDTASMTSSQYDTMIHEELERKWILNLSMHFRDKSKREKFFVTYREKEIFWRRVTISLDYRSAPDNSLEMDLLHTKLQREKSAKIYEAIRESLEDIQFYETVTNLKLQTTDGRLHVHVVEDANEIIHYPAIRMIQHLRCRRVRESQIDFEAHMSGFVYKVRVDGETLIKKEIPGPDTVDEFLYEINALSQLHNSRNVIQFYGVVVDDYGEHVKGLLISFAEQGALIDVIYDHEHGLPWSRRERWAQQIVEGLSEVHEAGFVQGDFTLSNIVIDNDDNAKIIDINRRGCPVGWEPPEATPLIESNQRISMYIGVKSDLYQLGMVLWALAEQEDEPEAHARPLVISQDLDVPGWYRTVVGICLAENPRNRMQAIDLLRFFPAENIDAYIEPGNRPHISVDDGYLVQEFLVREQPTNGGHIVRTVQTPQDWNHRNSFGHTYVGSPTGLSSEPYYYPARGRSPPSPLPSNLDLCEPRWAPQPDLWATARRGSFERIRPTSEVDFVPIDKSSESVEHTAAAQSPGEDSSAENPNQQQKVNASIAENGFAVTKREGQSPRRVEDKEQLVEKITHVHERSLKDHKEQESPSRSAVEEQLNQVKSSHGPHISANCNIETEKPNSMGAADTDDIDAKSAQNPLFQEAGITEPEAPRTIALVSRAAEIQNNKSTNPTLGTEQVPKDEKIDSAVEMSFATATPSVTCGFSQSPTTTIPPELLGLGAGHDHTDDSEIRRGSGGSIDEADLESTLSDHQDI